MILLSKARFVIFLTGATETDFFEIGWWNYMTIASKIQTPYSVSVGNFFEVRFQLIMLSLWYRRAKDGTLILNLLYWHDRSVGDRLRLFRFSFWIHFDPVYFKAAATSFDEILPVAVYWSWTKRTDVFIFIGRKWRRRRRELEWFFWRACFSKVHGSQKKQKKEKICI